MATRDFAISIDVLDKNSPQIVEVHVVDRSVLSETDVAFVLDQLPVQAEARVDAQVHKPYLGVDIFYGKDSAVKGIVFASQSRILAVRIPDGTAKISAALYEKKTKLEATKPTPSQRLKGKPNATAAVEVLSYERLNNLLKSNLAAFGMAQISLTLWNTLRERVEGVNLSTAVSEKLSPPPRIVPDPAASGDADNDEPTPKREKHGGARGGKKESAQENRGKRGRGGRGGKRGGGGRGGSADGGKGQQEPGPVEKRKTKIIKLPDDEEPNWDRDIISPGDVVKRVYPDASKLGVNKSFIGQALESNMEDRVVEAGVRAWISYSMANHPNLNSSVQDAPIVKPSNLNDTELTFFSDSMISAWKVMGEQEAGRIIELEDIKASGKDMLESLVHKSKIRAGDNQELTYFMKDGTEKTYFMKKPLGEKYLKHTRLTENEDEEEETPSTDRGHSERGEGSRGGRGGRRGRGGGSWDRKGQVRENDEFSSDLKGHPDLDPTNTDQEHDIDMSEVQEVSLYGREEATMAETRRDRFILRLLEGRGSLRGPEYEDCEFIRRIWFPTPAQEATGRARKEKNTPAVEAQRHDWMDDSWGDDTDEEEAARKANAPVVNLVENDTEDEDLGHDLQKNQIIPELAKSVNPSQLKVIGRVTAPNPSGRTRATLVHGPPGTGKTTTISAAVIRLVNSGEPVWIVAQSNVGIRNVADKLRRVGYSDFILLVAQDYYVWWQERYKELKPFLIPTSALRRENERKRIHSTKMVLSTLASLSSRLVEKFEVFDHVPLRHLVIDEASQIDMTSEFMHLFFNHRHTLKSVCWFGDPMQLPPYGWSEDRKINDIFKVDHLQANSKLLNTSYRLPIPIADYISKDVYKGELKAWDNHPVKKPIDAVLFIDVPDGEEQREEFGTSFTNEAEANLVVQIAQLYYERVNEADEEGGKYDYEIITPYEAQRNLVAKKLKDAGIPKQVYNVDSFQGNEAEYIITTLTKTNFSSFLSSINRLNVLITRCQRGLIVLTKKDFITRTGGLLRGLWWSMESHNVWASSEDVANGCVNLPGSPAPNEYGSTDEE